MIPQLFSQSFLTETIPDFIIKLYLCLEDPQHHPVIAWTPDHLAFQILNPRQLQQSLLPEIFHQNTLNSFVRQLHMYRFKKRSKGKVEEMVFQHPHFRRNNLSQLILIKRKPRGYVERLKLQHQQNTKFLERHAVFTQGVLNKLQSLLAPFQQALPDVFQLISEAKSPLPLDTQKQQSSPLPSLSEIPSQTSQDCKKIQNMYYYPLMTSHNSMLPLENFPVVPFVVSFVTFPELP